MVDVLCQEEVYGQESLCSRAVVLRKGLYILVNQLLKEKSNVPLGPSYKIESPALKDQTLSKGSVCLFC